MFDIHFLVDDRKLAEVLTALDGKALDLQVRPVRHAVVKNGKVQSTAPEGSFPSLALAHLKKMGKRPLVAADIRAACKAAGGSEGSYSYLIEKLVSAKKLSRRGTHSHNYTYTVL